MAHERIRFVVEQPEAARTLAALVRDQLAPCPWSRARTLIHSGRVSVNDEVCFDDAVRPPHGAQIEVTPTGRKRSVPTLDPDAILYVDHEVVVVRKPVGLVVVGHEDEQVDCLLERTKQALQEEANRRGKKFRVGLGVVHRLDKDTSGLVVFARTHTARKHLQNQLRAHSMVRRYLAIAYGAVIPCTIDTHLVPNRGDGRRGSWRGEGRPPQIAKQAITHVRVLEDLRDATLVECRLETGRQHQIRIHLAEAGHPVLGDDIYWPPALKSVAANCSLALHASTLGFRHPNDERLVQFDEPPPDSFVRELEARRGGVTLR